MTPQVLIVGAGPVGLTLAVELARYGVPLRIIDKAAARTDRSKALVVWTRTLELLERAGLAETFVAAGHKVHAANFVAGGKQIGKIGLSGVASPYPFALMLPQSDTERLLETHLSRLGVTVERRTELTGFTQDAHHVAATLRHPDGRVEALRVPWLAGSDGAHSLVRHGLDLAFEGETLTSDWMLADIHLAGCPFPDDELAIFLHADGLLALFPIEPGRYRIIADGGTSTGQHPPEPTLEQIQAVVDQRGPGGMTVSDPIWLSGFRINERKVKDYRVGRTFLLGDAAHIHSPAGGQGMNTGMQDAFNLAWKLALVCRRACAPDPLLDSYSPERSAVGDMVLANAGRMTQVGTVKNHAAQAVRNLVGRVVLGLHAVQHTMADTLSEVSVGYPHSPLNGPARRGGPQPGERVVPAAGEAPFGAGEVPRYALMARPGPEMDAVLREFEWVLESDVRAPPGDGCWLVRPDGYAAAAGDAAAMRMALTGFASQAVL